MTCLTDTSVDADSTDAYQTRIEQLFEEIWQIYTDKDSWTEENRSFDTTDLVVCKQYPTYGKVFRLSSTINGSPSIIGRILFEDQMEMPTWTSSVDECRILEMINNDLYITYTATSEQIQGLIAKRDFINLAARRIIDNVTMIGAQACLYPDQPVKENCVRAENRLTAYIIEKIDETSVKFSWILNVDLKGWLPQYLINNALSGVQLAFAQSLRQRLADRID